MVSSVSGLNKGDAMLCPHAISTTTTTQVGRRRTRRRIDMVADVACRKASASSESRGAVSLNQFKIHQGPTRRVAIEEMRLAASWAALQNQATEPRLWRRTMHIRELTMITLAALSLMACGKQEQAPAAAQNPPSASVATTEASPPAAPVAENTLGKSVYGKTCAMCHAAGVGGAPKPGDKTDWGQRLAQGEGVLYQHALEGFTGAKGMMPPRGGSPALKDEEVKAAVDYMVAQSR